MILIDGALVLPDGILYQKAVCKRFDDCALYGPAPGTAGIGLCGSLSTKALANAFA